MPQFIVECSEDVLKQQSEKVMMAKVHSSAIASELFSENDIKVRLRSYDEYSIGNEAKPFIHVFSFILKGRSESQKEHLSKLVVGKLSEILPDTLHISMNIQEVEKEDFFSRKML
ncbi:5-carboxymethyl-2-hydroxymuconate isomerase [Shewanella sp. OPT22]|nr:5-carboxymethyl-2-hydroxymuconate isomerase [Shewanella sp. OPT22]